MFRKLHATLAVGAAALGLAAVAQAAGTPAQVPVGAQRGDLDRIARPGKRFDHAFESTVEGVEKLKKRIEAMASGVPAGAATSGSVAGIPRSTLDAIAACESGGNPAAVNAAGYYGKYQFDMGTWASVGGSGNPAEASEDEQDYRAALLYQRAGSSPWPVCGV